MLPRSRNIVDIKILILVLKQQNFAFFSNKDIENFVDRFTNSKLLFEQ